MEIWPPPMYNGFLYGGGTNVEVYVAVNTQVDNAISIGNEVGSTIGSAVQSGIEAAASNASEIVQDAAAKIDKGLETVVTTIQDGTQTLIQKIQDVLGTIWDKIIHTVQTVFDDILKPITAVLNTIGSAVSTLLKPVQALLDDIVGQIKSINDNLIQPIATLYNTSIKTITSLTEAIEKDLHDGLSGLLRVPTDIASAMTSLDATMQRTIQELARGNKALIDSDWRPMIGATIGVPLGSLSAALKGGFAGGVIKTTYDDLVTLKDQCDPGSIEAWIAKTQDEIAKSDTWWSDLLKGLLNALLSLDFLLQGLAQKRECIAEDARKHLPITKLDAGTALEAWVRSFIDASSLQHELEVKGFDSERIQVLKDLQRHLVDVETALSWWYRGIIDDSDLQDNLQQHGILTRDVEAFKRGSLNPFPPELAQELYLRGIIDANALNGAWKRGRMSDQEREGRFDTLLRQPNMQEVMRQYSQGLMVQHGFSLPTYREAASTEFVNVAKREKLDPSTANIYWRLHWFVPGLNSAIDLYFRGLRTRTELEAIMDYYAVPPEIKDELIEAQRPLIPYRSVPAMIKAGQLTVEQGRRILESHGFDEHTVLLLLAHADIANKTTKADTAATLHGASLTAAKTLYLDGAITQIQYSEVLTAHGFDADGVQLEIMATDLTDAVRQRKELATDIINEALMGLITYDQAQTQLASNNYTVAEQAKYLKALRSGQKAASKLPTEAELASMLKKGIIEEQDYIDGVELLGFSELWASRLLQMRTT
jgi:hypothetical protein